MVIGLDEAGRGPLAGPVVAAAVSIEPLPRIRSKLMKIGDIKDSKKIASGKRKRLFEGLVSHPAVRWGTGVVSENIIDKINILEATKLAMIRALMNLQGKYWHKTIPFLSSHQLQLPLYFLLIDGRVELDLPLPQKYISKADQKVFSCAVASIIAKVKRDQLMKDFSKEYPKYNFDEHKGYATRKHLRRLKKHGPCDIHRKSFEPIRELLIEEA